MKIMITIFLLTSSIFAFTMAPDGTYHTGTSTTIAPDGSFVGGTGFELTPDGSYVGTY